MASIRQNPNGTFTATVYVGRDANGKMLRKYITMDNKTELKKAARKLEVEVESHDLNHLALMKMSDYMDTWLNINKPLLANTTVKGYKMYIEHHFKPALGKLKVNQITDMHIKQYITDKISTLSTTTVRKHFFTLSKILGDALKGKNPCIGIKPPKNSDYKPKVPTEEEFKLIYNTFRAISLEDEIIILLAGWCGLRRGEIFALKIDDINEDNGTIRIDEAVALEEDGYQFDFKSPKSSNGIRTIVAPDYLMELLKAQAKLIKKTDDEVVELEKQKNTNVPLFKQNPHSFTKKYAKMIKDKDLSLPKVRFHDLRHYHASLLYKNKVPDLYAAERLGHDIWVLKKIYQHLGLEEKKEIDQQVKNIFK